MNVNSDFEIRYDLIDDITSVSSITESDIIKETLSYEIVYSDIYNRIDFKHNKDILTQLTNGNIYTAFPDRNFFSYLENDTILDEELSVLHGVYKTKQIDLFLEDVSSFKTRFINILKNRKMRIAFETKGINFQSKLGDNFNLNHSRILNGTRPIKIFGLRKSAFKTEITAFDLLGI